MCGISGHLSFDGIDDQAINSTRSRSHSLRHRGPDDHGEYIDEHIALFHHRLSIIDLSSAGHQPMLSPDGNYVLAYNGECYNYQSLRTELESKGIVFQSNSDTEVVLHLLIEHGTKAFSMINGFFSLAFYKISGKELILARDRFGIKPMYCASSQNGISFASELKGLNAFGKKELDEDAFLGYRHLNYVPSPLSIYKNQFKLRPGHCLHFSQSGLEQSAFYSLVKYQDGKKVENDAIFEALSEAVKTRLVADVPVGTFLSGGLDSSIITGLAAKHSDKKVNSFTIAFSGDGQYDESGDARLVAKHFDTDHHEIEIDEEELLENIPEMLDKMDEPFADSSAIAMYSLCKKVSNEVKVALSGDGGDELFGGYYKHRATFRLRQQNSLNTILKKGKPILDLLPESREGKALNFLRQLKKYGKALNDDPFLTYWVLAGFGNEIAPIDQSRMLHKDFLEEVGIKNLTDVQDHLDADLQMVLEGDMLVKTDRMSMANALEVRVPFLDHHFVDLVRRTPLDQKMNGKEGKIILKDAFRDFLPKHTLEKKKHGFEVPLRKWMNGDLRGLVDQYLNEELIKDQALFEWNEVENLRNRLGKSNDGNTALSIWNLIVFNHWWSKNKSSQ